MRSQIIVSFYLRKFDYTFEIITRQVKGVYKLNSDSI